MTQKRFGEHGFTLLEVMIALAILAVGMMVLLQSQAASLNNAARSRDLTLATFLLRSKIVDHEISLFEDGFTLGVQEEDGDFRDEGYPDIKWESKTSEIELDLSALVSLCAGLAGSENDDLDEGPGVCEQYLGTAEGTGGLFSGFTEQLGRSLRLLEVKVLWPVGPYTESMEVRTFVTKFDFGLERQLDGLPDVSGGLQSEPGSAAQPSGVVK